MSKDKPAPQPPPKPDHTRTDSKPDAPRRTDLDHDDPGGKRN